MPDFECFGNGSGMSGFESDDADPLAFFTSTLCIGIAVTRLHFEERSSISHDEVAQKCTARWIVGHRVKSDGKNIPDQRAIVTVEPGMFRIGNSRVTSAWILHAG